jgi:TATA-box binding protein (TBP) (component of TFIID and TFIIIB)
MDTKQCIEEHDVQFWQALNTIYDEKRLKYTPYITTITCCMYLCHAPKSIKDMCSMVLQPNSALLQSLIDDVFGGSSSFYSKSQHHKFQNCSIFILHDIATDGKRHKVAIKCFSNGTLHITGVKTLHRAYEIAEMFCTLMEVVEGGRGNEDYYTITKVAIQMVNVHACLSLEKECAINLNALYEILCVSQNTHGCTQYNTCTVSYNNDRHSGVIIKYMTTNMVLVTILVFDSGNILCSGIKDVTDMTESLYFVLNFMEQHKADIYFEASNILPTSRVKRAKGNKHFDYGKYIVLQ